MVTLDDFGGPGYVGGGRSVVRLCRYPLSERVGPLRVIPMCSASSSPANYRLSAPLSPYKKDVGSRLGRFVTAEPQEAGHRLPRNGKASWKGGNLFVTMSWLPRVPG